MTLPGGYHAQNGCHNCAHVWTPRMLLPGDGDCYVCLQGATPAPGETMGGMLGRIRATATCDVAPWGTCPQWMTAQGEVDV